MTVLPGNFFGKDLADECHGLLLRLVAAFLNAEADQDVIGRADLLQLDMFEAGAFQSAPQGAEIGISLGAGFDHHAAGEVDAVSKPGLEIENDRDEAEQRRHDEASSRPLHEGDLGLVRNEAKPVHAFDP